MQDFSILQLLKILSTQTPPAPKQNPTAPPPAGQKNENGTPPFEPKTKPQPEDTPPAPENEKGVSPRNAYQNFLSRHDEAVRRAKNTPQKGE